MSRNRTHIIIKEACLVIYMASLFGGSSRADNDSKYLDAVREFADNALKYGRDTYGPKHTPLFVDGLNVHTHEPVKWIAPNGDRWILSNLASQQNLFRTLDGLTRITGDPKYKQAAMEAIEYAFENLRSPNGLLYWGGHEAYDAMADRPCGRDIHELKSFYPYYELIWEVDPKATKQFIEAFWSAHILDWSNLDMDRHGNFDEFLEKPWDHEYKDGPVFFKSVNPWGRSFLSTGTDLVCSAAWLVRLSGGKEPFPWAERLAYRYVETRHPNTGISYHIYGKLPPLFLESYDSVMRKLDPGTAGFPTRGFPSAIQLNPIARPCCSGYFTSTPGITVHGEVFSWLSLLMVGETLGSEGEKFNQWALEGLTAIGKASYRKKDNVYVPILTEGTNLEGYVVKEDGPLGPKGVTLEPLPAGPSDFWAYTMGYRVTGDEFMWEMARSIALGNDLGDIGATLEVKPKLNSQSHCSEPYALLGFLELYKKSGNNAFLQMARGIGDNLLSNRFHKGFFAPSSKHIYAKFDAIDSLALLHLHSALGQGASKIPEVWPGMPFFEHFYRKKDIITDNQLIYTLTETTEPPVSLQEAAAAGDVKLIKSLIEEGFDIDGREDSFYKTALHRAAIGGHKDVVELLLASGADVNANGSGRTPLDYAVDNGHKEVAALLISKGADVNARNADGQTPLDIAVSRNQKDIVQLLLAKGAVISTIQEAAYMGDMAKVKAFIQENGDVSITDSRGYTALHFAAIGGHKDVAELLIARGADVDVIAEWWRTPLHMAARTGSTDVAECLIAHGAKVNAGGNWTPLQEAAYYSKDMVELLIAKGADVNAGPWTALHGAVDGNHLDTAQLLIQKGADTNSKDAKGLTPFHIAAWYRPKMVELLLSNGADINAKGNNGKTALSYAIENGHTEIVELLRKHGAKE